MELADRIGVSYQQLQKYENEKSRISLQRLLLLAKALDTSVESILSFPMGPRLSENAVRHAPALPREERTLVDLYRRIQSERLKRTVLKLVRDIVEQQQG